MALRWDWKEKCGEATLVQDFGRGLEEHKLALYTGNAFLIMLSEWTDDDGNDMYNMYSFWVDKYHMKNCLGLNKKEGYTENLYAGRDRITEIRLDKDRCKHLKDIVPALVQAFDNLKVEIYTE